MKHVFNWTVGSFFRTIGRIIAYLIVGALIAIAFSYRTKAATLTSKAVYTSGYWFQSDYNNWGSNNTFSYGLAPLSTVGKAYYDIGNINTTYSGQAYQLAFGFQYNLTAQKYYDITINFKSRDLTSNLNTTGVHLVSGSSSSSLNDTNILSLIGVTNNATTGNNTNILVIRIYAVQPISYWVIELSSDPNNITSVNNFGISSITIDEVDTTNSQEIINNQTNNTENIINNQNNTTQQIIDSQNELLGRKCSNLFDVSNFTTGTLDNDNGSLVYQNYAVIRGYDISTGSVTFGISSAWVGIVSDFVSVSSSSTYHLNFNNNLFYSRCALYNSDKSFISFIERNNTITTTSATKYVRCAFVTSTQLGADQTISSLSINSDNAPFCAYNSYSSKLDDTNNSINNLNDSITDDNVSDATNEAGNFFSNFTTNTHGLTSIITAPLSAIQSLTSATCSPLVLPIPFVNRDLTLPCMRPIYVENFGGFMTLYDTISLGIVSYWVLVRIFALVKDFKNPEHDEVEVMDL